jgi:hypothetical protein
MFVIAFKTALRFSETLLELSLDRGLIDIKRSYYTRSRNAIGKKKNVRSFDNLCILYTLISPVLQICGNMRGHAAREMPSIMGQDPGEKGGSIRKRISSEK